jgi:hypothetical protein
VPLVTVQAGRTGAERLVAPQLERLDVCRELHILHRLTVAESWRAPRGVTSRGADQCRPPSRLVQSREVVRQQASLWRGQRGERRAASGLLSSRWHRARGARARAHPLGSRRGRQKLVHGQGGGPSAAARSEVFCHRLARLKRTENTQTQTPSCDTSTYASTPCSSRPRAQTGAYEPSLWQSRNTSRQLCHASPTLAHGRQASARTRPSCTARTLLAGAGGRGRRAGDAAQTRLREGGRRHLGARAPG